MRSFRFNVWATTSSGPLTGSVTLDKKVHDGGGKEIKSLELFSMFKGKNAPPSSIKDLTECSKQLTNLVSGGGKATDKRPSAGPKGVYKLTEDQFLNVLPLAEQIIQDCTSHAQRVGNDLPQFFNMIRDSYRDGSGHVPFEIEDLITAQESKIMARFNADALIPTFGVEDGFKTHGVIGQTDHEQEIANAVARSETQTKMEMIQWAEDLIISALENIRKGVERGRSQGDALLHAIQQCSSMVEEFSDSPDLVAKLQDTIKMATQIDTSKAGLKDDLAREVAGDALAIFEAKPTQPEAETGEWTEQDEQALTQHTQDLEESYDSMPEEAVTFEPETGDTIVDTEPVQATPNKPLTYGWGEDDNDLF